MDTGHKVDAYSNIAPLLSISIQEFILIAIIVFYPIPSILSITLIPVCSFQLATVVYYRDWLPSTAAHLSTVSLLPSSSVHWVQAMQIN